MEAKPWCCHPDCSKDAELRLHDIAGGLPYDQRETDACVEHADSLGRGTEGVFVVGIMPVLTQGGILADDETVISALEGARDIVESLVCACGSERHYLEPIDGGLYVSDEGTVARICGPCWQGIALARAEAV